MTPSSVLLASPRHPFKFGEISDLPCRCTSSDLYTISLNICGNGGISVPLGLGEIPAARFLPQLVGPAFKDRQLLTFARALERGFAIPPRMPLRFRRARILPERGRRAVMKEFPRSCRIEAATAGDPYRASPHSIPRCSCNCKAQPR